jgi:hypothetical protein
MAADGFSVIQTFDILLMLLSVIFLQNTTIAELVYYALTRLIFICRDAKKMVLTQKKYRIAAVFLVLFVGN